MITDPVTLGISGDQTVFNLSELGPGARTKRTQTSDQVAPLNGDLTIQDMILTISHGGASAKDRERSLFRVDCQHAPTAAIAAGVTGDVGSSAAYIVLDTPSAKAPGGTFRTDVAKWLLARLLGFLSENATGAPDFDFSSNENVLKWIAREP